MAELQGPADHGEGMDEGSGPEDKNREKPRHHIGPINHIEFHHRFDGRLGQEGKCEALDDADEGELNGEHKPSISIWVASASLRSLSAGVGMGVDLLS